MVDPIRFSAHVQQDDYSGTAAADDADFETYSELLGLDADDLLILGVAVDATHPSIGVEGKNHADESYTHMEIIAIRRDLLPAAGGGLPALLAFGESIPVVRITVSLPNSAYKDGQPLDALSLLQRGSKRLSIVLWVESVQRAGLDSVRFIVEAERARELQPDGSWKEFPDD